MNDLIKLVFAQIPKYLFNFFNLVSSPKRFVRKRNVYKDQTLTKALTFLAISFVLTLILKVGGPAPFGRFLITFCYYYAVGLIGLQAFTVLAYGIAKVWDPELYALLIEAYKDKSFTNPKVQAYVARAAASGDFKKLLPLAAVNLMIWLGVAALLAWTIAGWGAYRELTTLAKKRSVLAGMIFICLYPVVFFLNYLLYFVLI